MRERWLQNRRPSKPHSPPEQQQDRCQCFPLTFFTSLMFHADWDNYKMDNDNPTNRRTYFRVIVRTANGVLHLFVDMAMNCVARQQDGNERGRRRRRVGEASIADLPDLVLQPNLPPPPAIQDTPYIIVAGGLLRDAGNQYDRANAARRWRFPLWFRLSAEIPITTLADIFRFFVRVLLRWH